MSRDSHSDAAIEKTHPPVSPTPVSRTGSPRRSRVIFASATIGLMAILALALGLGLGLGLKHHHHDSTAATASSLPPLQTSSADNFALGKVQGQAPQTRSYNFTISQVNGAPDGVSKPMLVVNVNTGSFTSIRFSLDYHPLTIIEVDGTLVEPYTVAGLVIAVAQRYSVLIHTNQTEGDGRYWMRTTLQTDMFTYDQPGQNVDIRGIIKYSNSNDTGLPTATDDPGVPGQGLNDMDTSLFVPAVVDAPPNSTR
ncbi:hypothetical protein PHLCEN_2v10883 [Hermanssonia centrifuga]|uniref:Plastocyanin-like domain-containing protein n=1 Tax=Hermanssonia centrifuga TaxID=98765 RepID=A0A2R6NLL8_9APHY|nr:hypothetical protein PHLCEN_2v10883 [Hermanssonia centrifuga]